MEQQNKQEQMAVTIPATGTVLLAGIAIGLLLLAIGSPTGSKWVISIGGFILSLSLFWGGLFHQKEPVAVRAVLIAIGGFIAVNVFLGSVGLSSLLR
jgi:hypothetical protein